MPRGMAGALSVSRPPPVGGWDARNALADMPLENAVILDNWFPSTDTCFLRKGYANSRTGLGGPVETILTYTGTDGDDEIFGAANGSIFDVSVAGAVGAAVVTGMTNDRWQPVSKDTAGGKFLLAFNGDDTPRQYDGTTWGTATITGPTAANLITGNDHQSRLWVIEKDSMSAWYGAVNAISGAFTEFPVPGATKGGFLMAMGTWTRDSGSGQDDVAVFLTSEGQAIVYAGTDPASASTWGQIGVFDIGKPIGRRCMVKDGGDLLMVTDDGLVGAATILIKDRSAADDVALTRQVRKAFNDAVQMYNTNFGWQPIIYPFGQMRIVNIPLSDTEAHQHVFNTTTGAPCRFTDLPALCWGLKGDEIYFGDPSGNVWQFDSGNTDNGSDINGDALQAFDYFGKPQVNKAIKRVEPIFTSAQDPAPALDLNTDWSVKNPVAFSSPTPAGYATWGVSKWGVGIWGSTGAVWRGWRGMEGPPCRAAALRVRVVSNNAQPNWLATNWIYQTGGVL